VLTVILYFSSFTNSHLFMTGIQNNAEQSAVNVPGMSCDLCPI